MTRSLPLARIALVLATLGAADARAIPAFARKYGTSCQTCHTVYPKLNPFGEAFRRRGYRFPGVDSDFAKDPPVPLGQDAHKQAFPAATWPGTLPALPPLALGFDGQAAAHPDPHSGGAAADGNAAFTLHDLVGAVHLWSGGSFDDWITFLAEVTFSSNHGLQIESARLHFSDLLGPRDALNLWVGQGQATLSSFGPGSSYLSDQRLASAPAAALFGALSDSFALGNPTAGLELYGMGWGRLDWSAGLNAGSDVAARPSENVYAHLGAKLGGMGLDGSNGGGAGDPSRPWEETALTVDAFVYHAASRFLTAGGATLQDTALAAGFGLRGQLASVELDAGGTFERHQRVQPDGSGATVYVQYDELSWIALPWLVPALRFELYRLEPDGGRPVWNAKLLPGVAALVRPNLKLVLAAQFESASGAPAGTWAAAGSYALATAVRQRVGFESEAVWLRLSTAW